MPPPARRSEAPHHRSPAPVPRSRPGLPFLPSPAYPDCNQPGVRPRDQLTAFFRASIAHVGMMQRAIAYLLFVVFLAGSIAPAFALPQPPQPVACHRSPMSGTPADAAAPSEPAVPRAMTHCHDMAAQSAHERHSSAPQSPNHSFGKNGCCSDHDCCHRQDRTQWVHAAPAVLLLRVDVATAHLTLPDVSIPPATPSDAHSGRAPPLT